MDLFHFIVVVDRDFYVPPDPSPTPLTKLNDAVIYLSWRKYIEHRLIHSTYNLHHITSTAKSKLQITFQNDMKASNSSYCIQKLKLEIAKTLLDFENSFHVGLGAGGIASQLVWTRCSNSFKSLRICLRKVNNAFEKGSKIF